MSDEREMNDLREQMGELANRAVVLGVSRLVEEVRENLAFPVDLRSFLAGTIAYGLADTPVPPEFGMPKVMESLEPHVARLELERAGDDGDHFADLPVFDPENGS